MDNKQKIVKSIINQMIGIFQEHLDEKKVIEVLDISLEVLPYVIIFFSSSMFPSDNIVRKKVINYIFEITHELNDFFEEKPWRKLMN